MIHWHDYLMLTKWLVLHGGEVQHLSRQRCLSIDIEFLQWLIRCWRLSWTQQSSGTESESIITDGLKGLANAGCLV